MAVDNSNAIRVDLQEIYNSCEQQTSYHSRVHKDDEDNQKIVICKDDYRMIHSWANEAAVLIADACNYITNTSQTGLDAISNPYTTENPNPNDEVTDIRDLMVDQKQTGEFLSKGVMDTMEFNVTQMQGITPLKYTVTQTQIRAAIIEYVLFKWYELNKITDAMRIKYEQFEFWLNALQNNTFNNQKTIKTQKPVWWI
jgi:hypothetical protein